jgi:hypothetical protein
MCGESAAGRVTVTWSGIPVEGGGELLQLGTAPAGQGVDVGEVEALQVATTFREVRLRR